MYSSNVGDVVPSIPSVENSRNCPYSLYNVMTRFCVDWTLSSPDVLVSSGTPSSANRYMFMEVKSTANTSTSLRLDSVPTACVWVEVTGHDTAPVKPFTGSSSATGLAPSTISPTYCPVTVPAELSPRNSNVYVPVSGSVECNPIPSRFEVSSVPFGRYRRTVGLIAGKFANLIATDSP